MNASPDKIAKSDASSKSSILDYNAPKVELIKDNDNSPDVKNEKESPNKNRLELPEICVISASSDASSRSERSGRLEYKKMKKDKTPGLKKSYSLGKDAPAVKEKPYRPLSAIPKFPIKVTKDSLENEQSDEDE